jgi:hypothetical protein
MEKCIEKSINMKNNGHLFQRSIRYIIPYVIVLSFTPCSVFGQLKPKMDMDSSTTKQVEMKDMQNEMMVPMAFFTHMGIPLPVGTYGLRTAALQTQQEEKSTTEFNFQFETGLSNTIGLFLGGEGLFDDPTLEIMFQYLIFRSKNGMSGLSPIIEIEFPLGTVAVRSINPLVGFASTLSNSKLAFNQVLHYSPLENLAEGSASIVVKVSEHIFIVSEISGVTEQDIHPIFNLLGGVKVKINNNILLGFAYQLPLTSNRSYSSQCVLQPNIMVQQ